MLHARIIINLSFDVGYIYIYDLRRSSTTNTVGIESRISNSIKCTKYIEFQLHNFGL